MKKIKLPHEFVNEAGDPKKYKQWWDKGPETQIRRKFGKEYNNAIENRVKLLLSLLDDPDKAEDYAEMDFLTLPDDIATQLVNMDPKVLHQLLDESTNEAQIQDLSFKSLLGLGAKATVKLGEDKLLQLSDALDYIGSEQADAVASHLNMAIELIQEREPKEAQPHIKKFQKACKKALKELDESVTESSNFGPHAEAGKILKGQKIKEVYYDMGTYYIELSNGKYIRFDVGGMQPTVGKIKDLDLNESRNDYSRDEIAQSEFGLDYDQLGKGEKEWVDDEIENNESVDEGNSDLTYSQASSLGKFDNAIKKHVEDNYSDLAYGDPKTNILGRFGHELSKASMKKIATVAKKSNDKVLAKLVKASIDAHKKLGIKLESVVTEAKGWNAVAKVMDAALKKASVSLSYAKEYVQSLERMAKRDAKQFFADYGDFTEDDFIEDVEHNMRNESVTESFASFTNSLNEKWNFSEAEVKNAAEELAKAMAKVDKVKVTVHDFEYDKGKGAGFDLSWDGDKSDGGTYAVSDNGDIINHAYPGKPKYGTITSSQRDFEKGIRATSKRRNESVNEVKLKKGDVLISAATGDRWRIVTPYGDGYRFRIGNQRGLSWHPTTWVDHMIRTEKMTLESKVTEATDVRYKKGDKIEYQLTHKGGVGKYADAMSKSKNTESGVIKKRIKGFGGTYKYLLTSGLELYASEIIGLTENEGVTEGRRIQTKRKYTENHPAKTVGKSAKIRNKILEALKDGKMNQASFDKLVKELSPDHKRWMKRNGKMFNVSEDGISLSRFGRRILKGIVVNESFADFTNE